MNTSDLPDAGEDVDLTLRHVSRQFPEDFARAILPSGARVTAAAWLDTQVTSRQRRLDRVLDVIADGQRRLEHTEWQLEWEPDLPFRVFEYHNMMATSAAAEHKTAVSAPSGAGSTAGPVAESAVFEPAMGALGVSIRSTLVLLSGREKPWPEEGMYRTSPSEAPFSGVTFRIDAVYQRTVAELRARDSPLWLIFAPLAVDADEGAMKQVVAELRTRASGREFEELAVALVVMADLDKRRRGLRSGIVALLNEETLMQNWIYKQGEAKGIEKGADQTLARGLRVAFVRQVGRQPTVEEDETIVRRAHDLSVDKLLEVNHFPADAFLTWLTH